MRFILIDEILELVPGKSVKARRFVSPEDDYFRDHFPGFPVVPGVLLTEMMAQAAGKCLDAEDPSRGRAMLAQIKSASFRAWVRPGATATIFGEIRSSQAQVATARCHVEVEGREVAAAELMFAFVDRSRFGPEARDELLEAFLAGGPGAVSGPLDA
jgi:3-hydroxyacyl-[acyl-carrier-protein] dehydratase